MSDQSVSRRLVVGALASGAACASLVSLDRSEVAESATPSDASPQEQAISRERQLLSPLAEGSRLLGWEVVAIAPLALGAVRVDMRGESGVAFAIEVLARDASPLAPVPPARTGKFAVHVNNGGDGRMPTAEEQGLAAMALAQVVAKNEAHVSAEGFFTHAERIAEHPVALMRHVDGSTLSGPFDPATARA